MKHPLVAAYVGLGITLPLVVAIIFAPQASAIGRAPSDLVPTPKGVTYKVGDMTVYEWETAKRYCTLAFYDNKPSLSCFAK